MAAEAFRIEIPINVKDNTDPGVSSAKGKMTAFDKVVDKTKQKLDSLTKNKRKIALEVADKVTSVLSKIGTTVRGLVGKAWQITMKVLDLATAPIRGVINLLKSPVLQLGATLGISFGMKDVIETYSGFEATMSKVQAISGATSDEIEKINAKSKELGATTSFTAQQVGEGFSYMAMAGWKTEDMLNGIDGILALAEASGESIGKTSDIVTDALTAFGYTAADAGHFSDVLATASSNANTNVAMMGETFKYVGAAAGALGYSAEDVALSIGLMANAGIKSSQAGTELNSIYTRLATNTNGATDAIKNLGIEFYNADGSARSWGSVLKDVRVATKNMTQEEKIAFANTVAGTRAQAGFLAMLNATETDYNKLTDAIENCDGAAQAMAATMRDNLQGSFTLLQSAVDGVKLKLGERLAPYLRSFADWLTSKMPKVEEAIDKVMDFADNKIANLKSTIAEFTSGEDWANADIWGKMKIAWDKIVAEPFGEWWNSTGKAYITDKASSLGETLGSGLSTGLLTLLGLDTNGVVEEGRSVGASFIEGFKSGFKTEEITAALQNWASANSGVLIGIGSVIGFNLITGIAGKLNNVKSLFGGNGQSGTAGGLPSTGTVGRMTVSATTVTVNGGVVNVYGKSVSNASSAASKVATAAPAATSVGTSLVPSLTAGGAGIPALTGGAAAGVPLLGAGAATMGGAAGLTGISKLLTLGASSWITGADGTLLSVTGGLGGALTNLGGALGTTATTAAGSAAAGIGGSAGFLGSLLGLGSSVVDLVQGTKAINSGDNKTAKDEFVTAGTKSGMVLAGAGTGAAIGSVVPGLGTAIGGLVGAGIGGIAAFFGGDKSGKAISDSTDEGGKLSEMWGKTKSFFVDDVGNFFTKTIPEGWHQFGGDMKTFFTKTIPTGWGNFWGGVGNFFTSSVPNWWGGLKEKASTFFTETIPNGWSDMWEGIGNFFIEDVPFAIGYAAGKATTFFTETVPEFFGNLFDNIGTFFTDTVPTWASGVWNDHIVPFFTESVPNFFGGLWDSVSSFFTDTVPTWASGVWNDHIAPFFTESVPNFFSGLWQTISSFFTDTVPAWASNVWNGHIVPFFTESVPNFFTNLWNQLETFFTSTIPSWVSNIWNGHIVPFFTESVPNFFTTLLNNIGNFFTSTLPSWASNIFNGHIVPFFTSTLPGFFSTLWSTVSSMVAGQVASWGAAIAGKISGWWSTISGWIDSIWSSISGAFSAGFSLGSGKGGGKHAWGGILNAPHMAMVAEDGAEAIIPLSPSKRERGLDLWKKSGEMLGVQPYSEGGIVGNTSGITASTAAESAGNTVSVNLTLNPSFVIQTNESTSSDDIVAVIRSNIRDMVDDIGDELAERLARSFSNMPIKGGA